MELNKHFAERRALCACIISPNIRHFVHYFHNRVFFKSGRCLQKMMSSIGEFLKKFRTLKREGRQSLVWTCRNNWNATLTDDWHFFSLLVQKKEFFLHFIYFFIWIIKFFRKNNIAESTRGSRWFSHYFEGSNISHQKVNGESRHDDEYVTFKVLGCTFIAHKLNTIYFLKQLFLRITSIECQNYCEIVVILRWVGEKKNCFLYIFMFFE